MISRILYKTVISSLKSLPVVGIIGSRQVGKTTLAKEIQKNIPKAVYLDLELPSDLIKLQNAEYYLAENSDKLIIIDEIQREQKLFPLIRALVDQNRKPGRFLLLGSASPDFMKQSSESLAGRIIYHELTPFIINEFNGSKFNVNKLWLLGGYPLSLLAKDNIHSYNWREAFIKTYLERDIPQFGLKIPSVQLRKFWTMLAHLHGKLWNASQLAASMGLSAPTIKNYLDILTDTFIVRQLPPYFVNVKKRIIKSPKIYIRDTGLLHSLLNINDFDSLSGNPIVGHSWEGFVIEQILNAINSNFRNYFYRTSTGNEIDLIVEKNIKEIFAVEIKYSSAPVLSKGFYLAFNELKCKKGFIIYPGKDEYSINDKIKVVPLTNFIYSLKKYLG